VQQTQILWTRVAAWWGNGWMQQRRVKWAISFIPPAMGILDPLFLWAKFDA
jgi:hypothetical protein